MCALPKARRGGTEIAIRRIMENRKVGNEGRTNQACTTLRDYCTEQSDKIDNESYSRGYMSANERIL